MLPLKDNQYVYFPEYNRLINAEFKDTFLKNSQYCRVIEPAPVDVTVDDLAERVKTLKYVTFEVTQDCNLRCRYCVFVADYVYNRKLTPKRMEFATAKKTLDYLYHLNAAANVEKQFAVGFYGGEPLLNFKLMEQIVGYAQERFAGWKLSFNMTTNGTLLDDAIIDFMIRHDFITLVSLDGPAQLQDAKRKFASGRGTFAVVMANLRRIRQADPGYFNKRIRLKSTFSKDLSLSAQYEFFTNDELASKMSLRGGYVAPMDTLYYDRFQCDQARFSAEYLEVLFKVKDKLRERRELNPYERELVLPYETMLEMLGQNYISDSVQACLFDGRLLVDVDGRFHMCERINNQFPIGDAEHGHDLPRMKHYLNSFIAEVKRKCAGCEFQFFCPRCYIHLAKDGQFLVSDDFCDRIKRNARHSLESLIGLKEEGLL